MAQGLWFRGCLERHPSRVRVASILDILELTRNATGRAAMTELAKSMKPEDLAPRAFDLYTKFRPQIPRGQKGWGVKGELDLRTIRALGSNA
ncbi:MAG: hypothetical protein JXQ75_15255 [Phycisphaerae bacterium]|nr:hypothetical protein [Phycisphaerae bacterium]